MRRTVEMLSSVDVEIDESKFDAKFMEEFRDNFYDFYTLDAHIEHLGQLAMRGIAQNNRFIEGYGEPKDMGIRFHDESIDDVYIA